MTGRRRHAGILNGRQLEFVIAHQGNDVQAARVAGYKNPEKSAPRLMAMPAIRKAIQDKQRAIIAASGAKIGRRLTGVDVLNSALELASLPPEVTRFNINGQVNALRLVAEIQGVLGRRQDDAFMKELADRTSAEKEFFAAHGYWPNQMESTKPSAPGCSSPSSGGSQQEQENQPDANGEGGDAESV